MGLCVVGLGMSSGALVAAPPKPIAAKPVPRVVLKFEQEYLVDFAQPEHPLATGETIDVWLVSGKKYEGLIVANCRLDKERTGFLELTFRPGEGADGKPKSAKESPRKIETVQLARIIRDGKRFDVVNPPKGKGLRQLLDLERRDEVVTARLQKTGNRLWPEDSADEHAEGMSDVSELVTVTKGLFPEREWLVRETNYFVFMTDMPAGQVGGYIANLDAMYDQLCQLFGVVKGTNLWRGKCFVLAFVQPADFQRFEREVYQRGGLTNSVQGLCHAHGNGQVVISCYRGDDPAFFAAVLVHETAHGFIHRTRSSVPVLSWVNEGVADLIAGNVVKASDEVPRRQQRAVEFVRTEGNLGPDFFRPRGNIEAPQYGIAVNLTQFLLQQDANLYRGFVIAIKEGFPWQEALQLTYGMTPEELVSRYGKSLGLSKLSP